MVDDDDEFGGITRTVSFWWGDGASRAYPAASTQPRPPGSHGGSESTTAPVDGGGLQLRVAVADTLTIGVALAAVCAAAAFIEVMVGGSSAAKALGVTLPELVQTLFNVFIPGLSGLALVVLLLQLMRAAATRVKPLGLPDLGRKGILVCTSAVLFAFSCFYRAVNIADEGAAMCRSQPSGWNAPAAGRTVATVGEVALAVQVSLYIEATAARLGATRGLWGTVFRAYTSTPFSTVGPVLLAEVMSWSGVLSGNSKFFCAEYVLWCAVAFTWAWDGAELLHRSRGPRDTAIHGGLLTGALFLFLFNAAVEIPHFFQYTRGENGGGTDAAAAAAAAAPPRLGIWECVHDADSPLWTKRLPFFFCYFVGAAWSAVALAYRFVRAARTTQRRLHGRDKPKRQ